MNNNKFPRKADRGEENEINIEVSYLEWILLRLPYYLHSEEQIFVCFLGEKRI